MMRFLFILLFSHLIFGQQTNKVDFKSVSASLSFDVSKKQVFGNAEYVFDVKNLIDTIRIDAVNMNFSELKINNKSVKFSSDKKQLKLFEGFKKGKNILSFSYNAIPKQALYFINENENLQIWTQGQGKYTSHWLPSFDDVNEKMIFNLAITIDSNFEVIANGKLVKSEIISNQKKWFYRMKKPMSSYLAMLAIGKFVKQESKSKSGIALKNYLSTTDSEKFNYTYIYNDKIFNFLEKKIGCKYPWEVYKQVPVRDFLYAGMENTSATIFDNGYVVDEADYNDRNYININAHELAHQWFGDMVTAKSGEHHWLQEGFATYYALKAEKELFGQDYYDYKMYQTANQLIEASETDTIPVMNAKASSLSFYQKGAWALRIIEESIGEKKFDKAIKRYLKKYKFKSVETDDFLNEIKKVSDFDVLDFNKKWLQTSVFPLIEVKIILERNNTIKKLNEIKVLENVSFIDKKAKFKEILLSDNPSFIKSEVFYQIANEKFGDKQELIDIGLKSKDIEAVKSIVATQNAIPIEYKSKFESILEFPSNELKQMTFELLWNNFESEHPKYLEIASKFENNNDYSNRILFLKYAIQNSSLSEGNKQIYFNELLSYSTSKYESAIRQNAFVALLTINPKNQEVLLNLYDATSHFKWQFSKFAKTVLRNLYKNEDFKPTLEDMIFKLSIENQRRFNQIVE